MSDVVFGVFSGCYSDWRCIGWFPDAERAYQYCDVMNAERGEDYGFSGNYYVMPLRRIKCEFAEKPEVPWIRYNMWFDMDRDGGLKISRTNDDDETSFPDVEAERVERGEKSSITVSRFGRVSVKLFLRGYDEDKAIEIAEDQIEQWKMDIVVFMMDKQAEMQNSTDKAERRKWASSTWVRGFDAE